MDPATTGCSHIRGLRVDRGCRTNASMTSCWLALLLNKDRDCYQGRDNVRVKFNLCDASVLINSVLTTQTARMTIHLRAQMCKVEAHGQRSLVRLGRLRSQGGLLWLISCMPLNTAPLPVLPWLACQGIRVFALRLARAVRRILGLAIPLQSPHHNCGSRNARQLQSCVKSSSLVTGPIPPNCQITFCVPASLLFSYFNHSTLKRMKRY